MHFNGHTTYSLLYSSTTPKKLSTLYKDAGYKSGAITDLHNISGCVEFSEACKKNDIKPILGTKLILNSSNQEETLTILSKNLQGWYDLINISNTSNNKDNWNERPMLTYDKFKELYTSNLVIMTGHIGSEVWSAIFSTNVSHAYNANSYDEAKFFVSQTWKDNLVTLFNKYKNLAGDNFYVELQNNIEECPATIIVSKAIKFVADKLGIKCIPIMPSFYHKPEQQSDQKILLANEFKCNINSLLVNCSTSYEKLMVIPLLKSNKFCFNTDWSSYEESDLKNHAELEAKFEEYTITNKPKVIKYENKSDDETLAILEQIALEGLKTRGLSNPKYIERLQDELTVVKEFPLLAHYFMLVQDYISYAKKQGWCCGVGRGSAAGCLISYAIQITDVDPIKHDLLFSRFYADSRSVPNTVSFDELPFNKF